MKPGLPFGESAIGDGNVSYSMEIKINIYIVHIIYICTITHAYNIIYICVSCYITYYNIYKYKFTVHLGNTIKFQWPMFLQCIAAN